MSCLIRDNWRQSGEAQKLLHGEVGNLHDFYTHPQNMHFSCFSVMEVLVSNHPPLRVDLSYRFCQSGPLRFDCLCVLIDRYGVLWLMCCYSMAVR